MTSFEPERSSADWEEKIRQKLRPRLRESVQPRSLIEHWIKAFSSNNFYCVKKEATEDFMKYKEESLPLLIEASRSDNAGVRHWAVYHLAKLADSRAIDALKARLKVGAEWQWTYIDAAEGLYKAGEREFAIKYLVNLFLDKDVHRDIRMRSAERLVKLGLKKVIPPDVNLDLENIPPYLREDFKKLFQELS